MKHKHAWASAIVSAAVLASGVFLMMALVWLREPPPEAERPEQALSVLAREVYPEEHPVVIRGFGEARTQRSVEITPETAGRVVGIHPNLDVGEVIPEGETLFAVNPEDYEAAVDELQASVSQMRAGIRRLHTQMANDEERLVNLERSRDLARQEFERLRGLLEEDQVGTQSGVDQAEHAYNQAQDQVDQLKRVIALYPIEIEDAESRLTSAQARLRRATLDLERTVVTAPFDARIKIRNIELGQTVTGASPVLTLADDSLLEIRVPVDSQDVRRWLQFAEQENPSARSWFANLTTEPARILWTEDRDSHVWTGQVHRIEQFSESTRTVHVVVRIEGEEALSRDGGLPLVEGMFCEVEIPGRTMEAVYELPRWAVSFENTVYIANDNRLRTVPVEVARTEGNNVYVSGGLEPGQKVVVTRLVDPLEGALLDVELEGQQDEELL